MFCPNKKPQFCRLCPFSLFGFISLDTTRVSIIFLLYKSTPCKFFITGISNPSILCPIRVSAFSRYSMPSCMWSGSNVLTLPSSSIVTIHHILVAFKSSVSMSKTNFIRATPAHLVQVLINLVLLIYLSQYHILDL